MKYAERFYDHPVRCRHTYLARQKETEGNLAIFSLIALIAIFAVVMF